MTLGEWLEREKIEMRDFARRIDRTPEAVRRYVVGDRIPDKGTMPLIVAATAGEVAPNDFFGIPTAVAA